jgi:hypothetical protein
LENVVILALAPNDRLVVETATRVTTEEAERIRDWTADFAGVAPQRVLVIYNATLKVLREAEPPPPPVIMPPGRGI